MGVAHLVEGDQLDQNEADWHKQEVGDEGRVSEGGQPCCQKESNIDCLALESVVFEGAFREVLVAVEDDLGTDLGDEHDDCSDEHEVGGVGTLEGLS